MPQPSPSMRSRLLLVALAGSLLAACGGAATAPTAAPSTSSTAPTASPTTVPTASTSSAAAGTWTVTSASKATASVREQLVGVNLPSDAVLTATGATGSFAVNADWSFSADSKIAFDLTTLASDQRQRDDFVKQSTLQTRQFPTASFVPTKATGLTLPIASGADLRFSLVGKMTIHGVTKDVTFDVVAKRSGNELTATATANPTLRFGDFGMSAPAVPVRVVSVTDAIRLVIELTATTA